MKVILNVTLKGSQLWMKGEVFDSTKEPLPSEIQNLVNQKSLLVTIVPEPTVNKPAIQKEPEPPVIQQKEPVKEEEKEVKTVLDEEKQVGKSVQEETPVEVKPKLTKKTADVKPKATIVKKVRK